MRFFRNAVSHRRCQFIDQTPSVQHWQTHQWQVTCCKGNLVCIIPCTFCDHARVARRDAWKFVVITCVYLLIGIRVRTGCCRSRLNNSFCLNADMGVGKSRVNRCMPAYLCVPFGFAVIISGAVNIFSLLLIIELFGLFVYVMLNFLFVW